LKKRLRRLGINRRPGRHGVVGSAEPGWHRRAVPAWDARKYMDNESGYVKAQIRPPVPGSGVPVSLTSPG